MRAGAFARSLQRGTGLPMLLQHRPGAIAGRWVRMIEDGRGADVAESWALPEAENAGRFAVAFDFGAGFAAPEVVEAPSAVWPEGAVAARVAEIGPDGRTGAWQSCAA